MHIDKALVIVEKLLSDLKQLKDICPEANVTVLPCPDGGYTGDPEEFPYAFTVPDEKQLDEWRADGDPLDTICIAMNYE